MMMEMFTCLCLCGSIRVMGELSVFARVCVSVHVCLCACFCFCACVCISVMCEMERVS